ncbi:MAG: hypothetical protein AB7E81_20355 [Hyphomicrobiaceae bacterium]
MTTQEKSATSGKKDAGAVKQKRDLDDALDATFPASDPVTVGDETGDEPSGAPKERRTPPLDVDLVKKLARELKREKKDE